MKKILSVLLAVMMLFGALSIGASAAAVTVNRDTLHTAGVLNQNQIVAVFDINGGTLRDPQWCYDAQNGWTYQSEISGAYVMLPYQSEVAMTADSSILLPLVTPPSGMQFLYWEFFDSTGVRHTLAAGGSLKVTQDMFDYPHYGVINLTAVYTSAEPETDTMATILNILIKVFGAIIGIIVYSGDTEAGVALMEKVLGGLDL